MNDFVLPYIREIKAQLRSTCDVAGAFARIRRHVLAEVEELQRLDAAGESTVPQIDFGCIASHRVSSAQVAEIKRRGAVIVRGIFARSQAQDWNAMVGEYIDQVDYLSKREQRAGLDNYFSDLQDNVPQIFGLYWSLPQVQARQAESMAQVKRFLNRLWHVGGPAGDEFDPDNDLSYADRTRRRAPGDTMLGLSPHMDAGSYERWVDPAYLQIYRSIYSGDVEGYDPWRARFRTQTREFASPAVCSMFRTFQGWTALTEQGAGDGTLQLVPIAKGIGYLLLRALQDDVAEDDLCGATPGRALGADPQWHEELLAGLYSIPTVEPGDAVFWHPDIVHAVESEHGGKEYANVIYIGASPRCCKNEAYARKQAEHFLAGRSAPDFAAEDYEVGVTQRAGLDDLTALGRKQMLL